MYVDLVGIECFSLADVWEIELIALGQDFLQRELGVKTGDMLWSYARGIDIREVQPAQVYMHLCHFPSCKSSKEFVIVHTFRRSYCM